MGSALMGSLQQFHVFVDGGTFWALPLTCLYLPKSARAYLFPPSVKTHYLCSGPISADPACPQPKAADEDVAESRAKVESAVWQSFSRRLAMYSATVHRQQSKQKSSNDTKLSKLITQILIEALRTRGGDAGDADELPLGITIITIISMVVVVSCIVCINCHSDFTLV